MAGSTPVVWSHAAAADWVEILDFWFGHNQSAIYSLRLDDEMEKVCDQLAAFPHSGIVLRDNIWSDLVDNFKVIYHITPNQVEILKIWDTRRNPEDMFLG